MSKRDKDIKKKRHQMAQLATSHADRVIENWRYLARDALRRYLDCHYASFLTQDLIIWAGEHGLDEPPNKMAWGTVMTGAQKHNIIEKDGVTMNETNNAAYKPLWKATEKYRLREPGDEDDADTEWLKGPPDLFKPGGGSMVPPPTPEADDALGVPSDYRQENAVEDAPDALPGDPESEEQESIEEPPVPRAPAIEPPKPDQGSLF